MSSISFPDPHHHSRADEGHHADQFYTPSFDTTAFQMNPHSSHPPRTPRTSLHASSAHFASSHSIYDEKGPAAAAAGAAGAQTLVVDADTDGSELDPEEERVQRLAQRVRPEEVWREMLLSSNGRDKAFKLIQYTIRLALALHGTLTATRLLRRPERPRWETGLVARLATTADGFSFARKLMLLFNWLGPLTQVMAQQAVPFSAEVSAEAAKRVQRPLVQALLYAPPPVLLELVNAVADDVYTWSRLGLLGKRVGERAGRFSDWCWFLGTLVGLVENGVERQMIGGLQAEVEGRMYAESMTGATAASKPKSSKVDDKELARLRTQDYWLQITRAKLLMDLIFVSYELFSLRRGRTSVKAFTGLASALLSSAKIYDRHKGALVKTLLASAA